MKTKFLYICIPVIFFIGLFYIGWYTHEPVSAPSSTVDKTETARPKANETSTTTVAATNIQQSEIDALKKEVDTLKNKKPQIATKETPSPSINIPAIISQWRPRIAYIECDFYYSNDNYHESKAGSGTLVNFQSGTKLITNRHVVSSQDIYNVGTNGKCRSKFPDDNNIFTSGIDDITFSVTLKYDYGYIVITPDEHLNNLSLVNYCAQKAVIGDTVIILGYPGIGSQTDITATEGIISGYDGDYYITSAKIEHGNSGGAAILVRPEGNCYLGPPSFTVSGSIESLARILDFHSIP